MSDSDLSDYDDSLDEDYELMMALEEAHPSKYQPEEERSPSPPPFNEKPIPTIPIKASPSRVRSQTPFGGLVADINRYAVVKQMAIRDIINLYRADRAFNDDVCNNKQLWQRLGQERLSSDKGVIMKRNITDLKRDLHRFESPHKDTVKEFAVLGYDKAVFALLEEQPSQSGSALIGAADGGNTELVSMLLEEPYVSYIPDPALGEALTSAAARGYEDIFALLYQEPYKSRMPPLSPMWALENAAGRGSYDVVKTLLDDGHRSPDALLYAARNGHLDIARLLLLRQGPTHVEDAIEAASKRGHSDIVELLLPHKPIRYY